MTGRQPAKSPGSRAERASSLPLPSPRGPVSDHTHAGTVPSRRRRPREALLPLPQPEPRAEPDPHPALGPRGPPSVLPGGRLCVRRGHFVTPGEEVTPAHAWSFLWWGRHLLSCHRHARLCAARLPAMSPSWHTRDPSSSLAPGPAADSAAQPQREPRLVLDLPASAASQGPPEAPPSRAAGGPTVHLALPPCVSAQPSRTTTERCPQVPAPSQGGLRTSPTVGAPSIQRWPHEPRAPCMGPAGTRLLGPNARPAPGTDQPQKGMSSHSHSRTHTLTLTLTLGREQRLCSRLKPLGCQPPGWVT